MFHWHKEIDRLDIPAAKVFHLERSLSAVQVALPGLPSQDATAYLCIYSHGKGVRVALVLHLLTSRRLAFYLHDEEAVPQQDASRLIDAGINFAESLGFMLTDVDYRKLGAQQRASLWGSLPLKYGIETTAPIPSGSTATSEEVVISAPEMLVAERALESSQQQFPAPVDESMAEILEEPELPETLELPIEFEESALEKEPERSLVLAETAIPESEVTVEFEDPAVPVEPQTMELSAEKDFNSADQTSSFRPPPASALDCASANDACDARPHQLGAAVGSESEQPLDSALIQRPVVSGEVPTVRPPAQKKPPSAEEARVCRRKLLESLGRFLASL